MSELEELEERLRVQLITAEEMALELIKIFSQSETALQYCHEVRVATKREVYQSVQLRAQSRLLRRQAGR